VGVPAVSVILPCFDRADYLRATVASVFAQTFQDWELIVADDGSGEATRSFLRELEADPRIRVVWGEHSGNPARARNASLGVARGRYLAFLDSDDIWEPPKLERQLERLRLRPSCRWCYSAFIRIDGQGRLLAAEATRRWKPLEGAIFEYILRGDASLRTPSVLASRELVAEVGGFDETLQDAEDLDLWLRLALAADVAVVNEPLVRVRIASDSYTSRQRHARADLIRVIEKMHGLAGPRWQRSLRLERAHQTSLLAREYAEAGKRGPALRTLAGSASLCLRYPRYWHEVARALGRALLPQGR
jgi:glycosyltransferase involved in cell wall biosynthesis